MGLLATEPLVCQQQLESQADKISGILVLDTPPGGACVLAMVWGGGCLCLPTGEVTLVILV